MKKRRVKAKPKASRARRSVKSSLDRLEAAFVATRDRMSDVAAVVDDVGAAAIEARLHEMAKAAVTEGLARDLALARARVEAGGRLDAVDLRSLGLLLRATLEWFERHVGLKAELEAGQRLDVRASALGRFVVEGDAEPPRGDVVSLHVEAPGWTRGRKVLAKPRVRVVG